ncbi:AmpA [Neisseria gonorrhoeae]|uniref:AmpA n=1 Tax=Neisseria gonorrhoeae TaxID=485 RepID=A0A378VUH3_NEIGO|nr:AmpA [Neisseria gonorrhoeae]
MEFSTKTEILQEQQAGAQLFVCADKAPEHNTAAHALFSALEEGQNFPTPKSRRTTVCRQSPSSASKKPTAPR